MAGDLGNGVKLIRPKAVQHGGTTDTAATAEIQAWFRKVIHVFAVFAVFAAPPC